MEFKHLIILRGIFREKLNSQTSNITNNNIHNIFGCLQLVQSFWNQLLHQQNIKTGYNQRENCWHHRLYAGLSWPQSKTGRADVVDWFLEPTLEPVGWVSSDPVLIKFFAKSLVRMLSDLIHWHKDMTAVAPICGIQTSCLWLAATLHQNWNQPRTNWIWVCWNLIWLVFICPSVLAVSGSLCWTNKVSVLLCNPDLIRVVSMCEHKCWLPVLGQASSVNTAGEPPETLSQAVSRRRVIFTPLWRWRDPRACSAHMKGGHLDMVPVCF